MTASRSLRLAAVTTQTVICGFSRSGSTLLYNMLRGTVADAEMPEREAGARQFAGRMDGDIVTKRPLDIFEIGRIEDAVAGRKALKVIVMLRDPRALMTSMHGGVAGEYFQGFDHCFQLNADRLPSYFNPGIVDTERAVRETLAGRTETLAVRYEDLIAAPDRIQAQIADFTGLALNGDFRDVHRRPIAEKLTPQLNGVRALDASRVAGWSAPEHAARLLRQFRLAPELFDMLERWGYARDRRWFDALAAHAPEAFDDAPGTIVGYYTPGTHYEAEARRMEASIRRLGLKLELLAIDSAGDWLANVRRKPQILLEQRRRLRGPLLYVDADAVMHRDPWPYLRLYDGDAAIANHQTGEIISATLLLNDTPGAVALLEAWIAEQARDPAAWDQWSLQKVVQANRADPFSPPLRVQYLPPSMCCVFDRTRRAVPSVDPFIEQLQASRVFRAAGGSEKDRDNLERREQRIAEIDRELSAAQTQSRLLLKQAKAQLAAKDYARAAESFAALLEAADSDSVLPRAELHRRYGSALIHAGETARGVAQTRKALAAADGNADLLCRCVDDFHRAGDNAAGWEALALAERAAPGSPEVRLRRARLLVADNRAQEASVVLDELLHDPELAATHRPSVEKLMERARFLIAHAAAQQADMPASAAEEIPKPTATSWLGRLWPGRKKA